MDDLIARLESATESSRELDQQICKALDITGPDIGGEFNLLPRRCYFSRSLDAVLTLIPKGRTYGVVRHGETELLNPEGGEAFVHNEGKDFYRSEAANPILAACAVAVRAKRG